MSCLLDAGLPLNCFTTRSREVFINAGVALQRCLLLIQLQVPITNHLKP